MVKLSVERTVFIDKSLNFNNFNTTEIFEIEISLNCISIKMDNSTKV